MTSTVPGLPAGLWNYDANDRLGLDVYDADGNTVNSGGLSYVYDFENRLVQQGGLSIVYDGDGNRVSKTVAGVTTQYLVDTQNPTGYAQVLDELQNGAVTRTYTWGLELIDQSRPQPSPNPTLVSYYIFDGHGSVRELTNPSGAVTDTYDYDAFGNLIHSTGSTPNSYLFAGEQFDPNLNLYYNRARYMNTNTGRFWTMDSYEGESDDPPSLHKYLYGADNPVSNVDQSGRDYVDAIAAVAVGGILNAIAFGSISFAFSKARGLSTSEAFKTALNAGGIGFLLAIPYVGAGVGLFYLGGFVWAAYNGRLSKLDYWEFATYVVAALALRQVTPGVVGTFIRSAEAAPSASSAPTSGPAQVFIVTEKGVAIPDAVQGTASSGGDFTGLAGADPVDVLRRVPRNWVVEDTAGQRGVIFRDPTNPSYNWIRIMPGDPNSPFPNSQGPYLRWFKSGSYVDASGNPVGSNDASGHIPLKGNPVTP